MSYRRLLGTLLASVCWWGPTYADDSLPDTIEFNRDVRPILSDHCVQCHGPDERQRQAGLRLDMAESALAERDGTRAVIPGHPETSELILRITSPDETERMPPAGFARQLTARQVSVLKRWIEQGAPWQQHWAWIPPVRPALPSVQNPDWCQTPVDRFILSRLEREQLRPSPSADKATLIRRVSFDLTGLPPTPDEVSQFEAEISSDAFEKVINRLLSSPHYGERMATRWLDGARYADTSGYQSDGERDMWRWRDWVIDAYNRNLPFDQFTIEQLAGDLLPDATLDQRIATGFNRNHRGNAEGGIVPEEYAVEYVVDRVDTTATVWLGLTMGCARCHDHKFDPLTQHEYYSLFALFNNIPERGRALKYGNSPPYISAPTASQQREWSRLEVDRNQATKAWNDLADAVADAQATWEMTSPQIGSEVPVIMRDLLFHMSFDGPPVTRNSTRPRRPANGYASKLRPGETALPPTPQIAAQWIPAEPARHPGVHGQGFVGDGQHYLQTSLPRTFSFYDSFSAACWLRPENTGGGTLLSQMTDVADADGWNWRLVDGRMQVHLTKRYLDDALRVESQEQLTSEEWQHVAFTYDGSRTAAGVRLYLNGRSIPTRVLLDELNQDFATTEPLRIGAGNGPEGRLHGQLDQVCFYERALTVDEIQTLAVSLPLAEVLQLPRDRRAPQQAAALRLYFLEHHLPDALRAIRTAMLDSQVQLEQFAASLPTVMVMEELPTPRTTHVLQRGEYDKPGETVAPGVPASLSGGRPIPTVRNRLEFARWLVSPDHPLTARVAVNRIWQMYFGTGLVKTVDDLGGQGEWPSHPELLDWLATELIRSGWDLQHLQRQIVLSATYQQSSRITPELLQRDPDNRLLARGPRQRLSAEMIRDQALAASGLLIKEIGGRSVLPYQPEGLWKDLTGTDFTQEHGASLYRRSLYTFWKRTVAPPGMVMFDASTREACTVREVRTNTPLQALNLMNDVTYVEAARVLAERVERETGGAPPDKLRRAFQYVLAREPRAAELAILLKARDFHAARFREAPAFIETYLRVGELVVNPQRNRLELAADTAVMQLLLNLDEAVNRQ